MLFDVWGTDENNLYAVGLVHFKGLPYGVIKWDGNEWKPEKLGGGTKSIFGFSSIDIWVVGNRVWRFDGSNWKEITSDQVLNQNVEYTSIWGTSSSNLYLKNGSGKIIHWDGHQGSLEEVPTEIDILDIYGCSENFILAAGNDFYLPGIALDFNGSIWDIVQGIDYNNISLVSVYSRNRKEVYYSGFGIIEYFGSIINHLTELIKKKSV